MSSGGSVLLLLVVHLDEFLDRYDQLIGLVLLESRDEEELGDDDGESGDVHPVTLLWPD